MKYPTTPPYSGLNTPEPQVSECSLAAAADTSMTPTSPPTVSLRPTPRTLKVQAFRDLTQDDIEADMQLKRRQQDLLVLTSLNDNSTLHWRPSWFRQDPFNKACWTLHNPPNVVTEKLPSCVPQSKDYYTRRIRQHSDPPALYIKTWDHWDRYCGLYGIPLDFLSEGQVNLMRLGLPRTEKGTLCGEIVAIGLYKNIIDGTQLPHHTHSIRNHSLEIVEATFSTLQHTLPIYRPSSIPSTTTWHLQRMSKLSLCILTAH